MGLRAWGALHEHGVGKLEYTSKWRRGPLRLRLVAGAWWPLFFTTVMQGLFWKARIASERLTAAHATDVRDSASAWRKATVAVGQDMGSAVAVGAAASRLRSATIIPAATVAEAQGASTPAEPARRQRPASASVVRRRGDSAASAPAAAAAAPARRKGAPPVRPGSAAPRVSSSSASFPQQSPVVEAAESAAPLDAGRGLGGAVSRIISKGWVPAPAGLGQRDRSIAVQGKSFALRFRTRLTVRGGAQSPHAALPPRSHQQQQQQQQQVQPELDDSNRSSRTRFVLPRSFVAVDRSRDACMRETYLRVGAEAVASAVRDEISGVRAQLLRVTSPFPVSFASTIAFEFRA